MFICGISGALPLSIFCFYLSEDYKTHPELGLLWAEETW